MRTPCLGYVLENGDDLDLSARQRTAHVEGSVSRQRLGTNKGQDKSRDRTTMTGIGGVVPIQRESPEKLQER